MQQHLPLAVLLHICLFHISVAFLKGSSLHEQEIHPTCDPGHFPCNSTGDCVEQKQNCDGKLDCEDGSDEWHCEDQNTKMLFNSQYRKRPDEDREKQVESCQLSNVSSECHCSGLKLYCDHQELKSPPYLPENITELHLSGNRLHVLEPTDFQLREQLHTLILTSSEVKLINKDALKNLPHLMRLHLPGNHITVFANGTLAANKDLRLLVLSHNPLSVLTAGAFDGLKNLDELDLRDCELQTLPIGVFDSLVRLRTLWLDGNLLSSLNKGLFRRLNNLGILSISRNEITVVDVTIWHGLTNLQRLSMSQNGLYSLESATFGNLTTLLHLDLHGNKIRSINKDAFLHLTNLESLNLRLNELRKPTEGAFDSLESLDYIYFDDFHLCSLALHVRVCEPRGDGISSIAHLLDNVVLRVSVWLVAVIAFVGNVAVLVGRLFFTEPNEVHSFYIKNLSLADLLMSVYLFIIAAYDVAFRGKYIFHETHWRHSWQCNLCGFLSTLSSESSVLILTIITIDRYLSIIHPLSVKKRAIPSAAAAMALAWVIAIILSALPILNISYYGDEFYGNNGVCLPLHIHDPFGQAWEYSTFLFCGANLAAFLFIAFAYVSMFFTISNSKIGLRCTQQQQDRNIAKRFAFIVATDFLCWVPIVCIKVVAMAGVPIQEDLYAWVAVFLLPVNSAINPILYTLTTKLFKQHLAKIVYNFKVSTGASGESMTPSAGRNHSLRDPQRNSLSQGDPNNINMTTTTICHDCRRSLKSKGIPNHSCRQCRRLSARKKDSFKIGSNMV